MKVFTDGTLLTAEDINNYLLNNTESAKSIISGFNGSLTSIRESLNAVTQMAHTEPSGGNVLANAGFPIKTAVFEPSTKTAIDYGHYNPFDSTAKFFMLDTGLKSLQMCAISLHDRGVLNFGIVCDKYSLDTVGRKELATRDNKIYVNAYRETVSESIKLHLAFKYSNDAYYSQHVMQDGSRKYVAFLAGEPA